MGQVQSLLRRATGQLAPRSSERQALAEAIDRCDAAATRVDRTRRAHQAIEADIFETLHPAVERATEAHREAQEREPQAIVDRLLGATQIAMGPSVEEAAATLAAAERALSDARRARDLLAAEITVATAALAGETHKVTVAMTAIVKSSPEVAALLARHSALRRDLAAIEGALEYLDERAALPGNSFAVGTGWRTVLRVDPAGAVAWRNAIDALAGNADARLPE